MPSLSIISSSMRKRLPPEDNERYWLTHEEEVSLMQANEAFQQRPLFEDLFFNIIVPSHKEEGLKISAGEIYLSLPKERRKTSDEQCLRLWSFLEKIGLKTQL